MSYRSTDSQALGALDGAIINMQKANEVITRPLDPKQIKTRAIGNFKMRYITGQYVIELLNEAFNRAWSFEILFHEIIQSADKQTWDKAKRQYKSTPQPPYALVLGRLTVPGMGVQEQYGSQVIVGGASEQMNAVKGAATDALKKCATLLGFGAELYDDNKAEDREDPYIETQYEDEVVFDPKDVDTLVSIKEQLNIVNNKDLDKFVAEFTGNEKATNDDITPQNIASFNTFLKEKHKLN